MDDIIKEIDENKQKIFKHEDLRDGINDYIFIKDNFDKGEILDSKFESRFSTFYRLNGAGLSKDFKERYFELLSKKETDLKYILTELYKAFSNKRTPHKVHFSFATKLLHTVNNHKPIYDSKVAELLNIKVTYLGNSNEKIQRYINVYNILEKIYSELLNNKNTKNIISEFRAIFHLEPNKISDTKILDFIMWILGKIKAEHQSK